MRVTVPVILAGGIGERFWPMSRSSSPKQLHAIGADKSMLEETLARVRECCLGDGDVKPMLITGAGIAQKVRAALGDGANVEIISEPVGKNTAPAIAIAAAVVNKRYGGDAVMIVASADHAIKPVSDFVNAVNCAVEVARKRGGLIVFGIKPSRPETGYGYIELGDGIDINASSQNCTAFNVKRFVEKPSAENAKMFMESGRFLWNSGMFVWKASTILDEFRQHMPELYGQAMDAAEKGFSEDAINEFYDVCCKESIDFGIMEKAGRVSVVCGSFFWDDLGSWEALSRVYGSDGDGTTVAGPLVYESDRTDSLIINKSTRTLAAVGLQNVAVVAVDDAVLVIDRSRLPDLKKYLSEIKGCGKFPENLF
jgi:mannose-1-phosphate guanylyltransferase